MHKLSTAHRPSVIFRLHRFVTAGYFRRKYKSKSKYTHIYRESLVKYVVSVIDYNISLFRTASRSNYAIIDYTMLQSASTVIFRNGIFHWPVKRINLNLQISIYMALPSSLFLGMILSNHRSSNKCNILQKRLNSYEIFYDRTTKG